MNTISLTVKQLSLVIGITIAVSIAIFSGGLFSAVSLRHQFADSNFLDNRDATTLLAHQENEVAESNAIEEALQPEKQTRSTRKRNRFTAVTSAEADPTTSMPDASNKDDHPSEAATLENPALTMPPYVAQIAIFTTEHRALTWASQFDDSEFKPRTFTKAGEKSKMLYAVIVGFYNDRKSAKKEGNRFFDRFSIRPYITRSDQLGKEVRNQGTAVQTLAGVQ